MRTDDRESWRDDGDKDDEIIQVQYWIPSAKVDLTVLQAYLGRFIDDAATMSPTPNPNDHEQIGYLIGAAKTLNFAQLQDIIGDSRSWKRERRSPEYRTGPYSLEESDAWTTRKKRGSSKATWVIRTRRPRSPSGQDE